MDEVLEPVVATLQVAVAAGFVLLAGIAVTAGRRQEPVAGWAAAAFAALALGVMALWVPAWVGVRRPPWATSVGLVAVLWSPYLLLRFTASLRSVPRRLELVAVAAALLASVLAPVRSVPREVLLAVVLPYWTGLSLVIVVRLWRAGRDQPGVARRRMWLMAGAVAVLNAALLVAVLSTDGPLASLVSHVFLLASVVGFGLGYRPPRPLRLAWRHREDAALQAATVTLLQADTEEEVARRLLPPAAAIVGARGAALVGADGRILVGHGQAPPVGAPADGHDGPSDLASVRRQVIDLGPGHGHLTVWASPYAPFFGRDEHALLQSMGATARLALERAELLSDERARRAAVEQARHQAETAREQAEAAREQADRANQAKSEFLSRMSHEFRTPLNAILGFGQLLELASREPEDQEAVAHILKAGRHLLALIDDVLDLSRVEAGTLSISLEPVHTGELVEDSVALVEPLARARGIRVTTPAEGCDIFVHTDRQRCRQVLLNLLSNAIKYNRDDGTVDVTYRRVGADTLRIAVQDTGPGIDPDRVQRLFEPFERLGAETSGVQGTGLGLALSRQMVERLGGAIGVDSMPGAGARFWIDLPVTDPQEQPSPSDGDESPHVTAGATRQVLLVEDNLANLRLVQALLRRRPELEVLPAMQGALALELAYEHRPDVVVLDLHLPDMSGREVLHRLRADPRTRHIPVVVASADAGPSRMRRLREEGAFDFLTKPLDVTRFMEVLERALAVDDTEPTRRTGQP